MEERKYYERYEQRYRSAYAAGAERWGHGPDNRELRRTLANWVEQNRLRGRRIIEFACGEGASGLILSKLGCIYYGVDVAPSAVAHARALLHNCTLARVSVLDMVQHRPQGTFDAALDAMGLHMLITDDDRRRYLKNAFAALCPGAPMLFYKEMYRADAYEGAVETDDQWSEITGVDYSSPQKLSAAARGGKVEVRVPFLPARHRNEAQYRTEMTSAGFAVDAFHVNDPSKEIQCSANIYVHKP